MTALDLLGQFQSKICLSWIIDCWQPFFPQRARSWTDHFYCNACHLIISTKFREKTDSQQLVSITCRCSTEEPAFLPGHFSEMSAEMKNVQNEFVHNSRKITGEKKHHTCRNFIHSCCFTAAVKIRMLVKFSSQLSVANSKYLGWPSFPLNTLLLFF